MTSTADRVVVGGGIVGWAAALELAERDAGRRIIVVDDGRPGAATPAGAGIATPFTRRDRGDDWTALMSAAMNTYAELIPRLRDAGHEPGHDAVGRVIVATDDGEARTLQKALARANEQVVRYGSLGMGTPVRLDGADVAALHPLLAPVVAGLWLPEVAQVDGRVLTAALRGRALGLGVTPVVGSAALDLAGDRVRGVRVNGEPVAAPSVIVAAGAWTDELLAAHGLATRTYPQRGQVVHARLESPARLPIASGFDETYLLVFGDRLVFGPTREDDSGFDGGPTIGGLGEMLDRARTLAPGIATARWIEIRSGLRPASRDGRPTIGAVDSVDGLVVATGLGAHGLTVGPHAGALATHLADGGTDLVSEAFSPSRWRTQSA